MNVRMLVAITATPMPPVRIRQEVSRALVTLALLVLVHHVLLTIYVPQVLATPMHLAPTPPMGWFVPAMEALLGTALLAI